MLEDSCSQEDQRTSFRPMLESTIKVVETLFGPCYRQRAGYSLQAYKTEPSPHRKRGLDPGRRILRSSNFRFS